MNLVADRKSCISISATAAPILGYCLTWYMHKGLSLGCVLRHQILVDVLAIYYKILRTVIEFNPQAQYYIKTVATLGYRINSMSYLADYVNTCVGAQTTVVCGRL